MVQFNSWMLHQFMNCLLARQYLRLCVYGLTAIISPCSSDKCSSSGHQWGNLQWKDHSHSEPVPEISTYHSHPSRPLLLVLESLDQEELVGRVRSVVGCPHKHCVTCEQHEEDTTVLHLVLIEGNMILSLSRLKPLFHSSLFITLDFELCKQRRSLRGDYFLPDPPHYLEDYVWPEYEKQKNKLEKNASVKFLDGSGSLKFLVQEAEAFMRSCIQQLTATDQPSS